jgi:hypothetical protein
MNFADKLLSHHSSVWAAIPFLLLVAGAVGLQYLQMSRLNARNPQAAQANPQAAMLQKYMPLIFGFIYLNVAAILNVYFIVSSAIRILTQEVLFRKGIVAGPPAAPTAGSDGPAEKRTKPPVADRTERALPKPKTAGASGGRNGTGAGGSRKTPTAGKPAAKGSPRPGAARKPATAGSANGGKPGANGAGPNRTGAKSTGNRNGTNGRAEGGSAAGSDPAPKAHPRSKAKRTRKAR